MRFGLGPGFKGFGVGDIVPPGIGPPYRMLGPAVDSDGNEIAGIRLPDVAVPTATFTGWNLRSESVGAAGALGRWTGSYLAFALTAEERKQSGDPRLSVADRYPTRDAYLARVAEAAIGLRDEGFLLDEDVVAILKTAAKRNYWPATRNNE